MEPTKEPIDTLAGPVQEAINALAKYYAEHHNLGMSIRDDLTYIAHVAKRWTNASGPSEEAVRNAEEMLKWDSHEDWKLVAREILRLAGRDK